VGISARHLLSTTPIRTDSRIGLIRPPCLKSDSLALSLPPRTIFYPLEPMHSGTADVESLASYVIALANAHSVNILDLASTDPETFGGEGDISSEIANDFATIVKNFNLSRAQISTFSQFGVRTRMWVDYLAGATGRQDMATLTLIPLEGVLSAKKLVHANIHWCPLCYEQWRLQKRRPYEPIQWSLAPVSICLHHRCFLEDVCPECGRSQKVFHSLMRSGYCPSCGKWLGSSRKVNRGKDDLLDYSVWAAKEVGNILRRIHDTKRQTEEDLGVVFMRNWVAGIKAAREYHGAAFRKLCNVSPHYRTDGPPVLSVLLRICYCLGLSPIQFFEDSFHSSIVVDGIAYREKTINLPRQRISRARMRSILLDALEEDPPRSVEEIAKGLGYKDSNPLRAAAAPVCREITARYRDANPVRRRNEYPASIKTRVLGELKASLAAKRPQRPSNIARRLGIRPSYPREWYPEICKKIDRKIGSSSEQRLLKAEELMKAALEWTPIPTLKDIANRAGYSSSSLEEHFPDLVEELMTRRKNQAKADKEELRRELLKCASEWPPPNWSEIERRAHRKVSTIYALTPDLYWVLKTRRREYAKNMKQQRRQELFDEVLAIVNSEMANGRVTTFARLPSLVKSRQSPSWTTLWAALKAARKAVTQIEETPR